MKDGETAQIVKLMRKLFDKWHRTEKYDRLDESFFSGKKNLQVWNKSIKDKMLIAAEGKEINGFINFEIKKRPDLYKIKEEGHINLLYVKDDYRKKGIGKALIEEVLKRFKERKLMFITVNTLALDKEANDFWKKRGFREYDTVYAKEE